MIILKKYDSENGKKSIFVCAESRIEDNYLFFNQCKNELQRYNKYGLPLNTESGKSINSELIKMQLKIFEITSSYGLSGWSATRRARPHSILSVTRNQ